MKSKIKKVFVGAVSALLVASSFIPSGSNSVSAASADDIELQLVTKSDVDVVLSLGNSSLNYGNFESDLKIALNNIGVNPNKVRIQAVETNSMNVQNSFNWINDVSSSIGNIGFSNNGTVINMVGNPTNAGFNRIFTDVNSQGVKTQDMSFTYSLDYGDSFDGGGVLFNLKPSSSSASALLNGYAIIFKSSGQGEVYRLINAPSRAEIVGGNSSYYSYIGSIPMGSSGNYTLRTTKDKVTVINRSTGGIIGSLNLPVHHGFGFGFFGDHYSHGCDMIGSFVLTNISLAQTTAKEFVEVIRMPEWRSNTERVLVHVDEETVPNFDSSIALGEIIPRLSNENINFLTYGNSVNASQFSKVLAMANNKGANYTVTNTSQYSTAVLNTAAYIKNLVEGSGSGKQTVLVGKPIDVSVNPSSLKNNTQTTAYPNGRWKIDHDYTYFENNLGQAGWANQYQKNLVMEFDKPGRYDVSFGESHPNPRYIYAHRAPIANFGFSFSSSGATRSVTYTDRSYDPDREFSSDKGIKSREWKWRESGSPNWNNGQLSSITEGKYYIVQLRVLDEYGEWSSSVQKFVSTDVNANILPVADFNLNTTTLTKYETLRYDDVSYSPNGMAITSRTWKVTNSAGTVIHNTGTPLTNLNGLGLGEYKISLIVRNSLGAVSEEFGRLITIVKDSSAPESIINPITKDWGNSNYNISVVTNDVGGSGFKNQQYVLNTSGSFPTSGFSSLSTSNTFTVPINTDGIYYLHTKAYDVEGNVMNRTSGPYKLDKTAPNNSVISLSETRWTVPGVTFTISNSGDGAGSGVSSVQYRIAGDSWKTYNGRVTIPANLAGRVLVESRVIDNVGNTSGISSATALIDDIKPTIKGVSIIKVNNDTQGFKVDAIDNESGLHTSGAYNYYLKAHGVDSDFRKVSTNVTNSVYDIPVSPSSTLSYIKTFVRDLNENESEISQVLPAVSAPVVREIKAGGDGEYDNTVTINLNNAIGKDVRVEVYRGSTLVNVLTAGSQYKDKNLYYERTYEYKLIAYSTVDGKRVESLPEIVSVEIGSPTLEAKPDNSIYYITPFTDEVSITGEVAFAQGGVALIDVLDKKNNNSKNKSGVTKITLSPQVKVSWKNIIKLSESEVNDKSRKNYRLELDLNEFKDLGLYKKSWDINVDYKDTKISSLEDSLKNKLY